MDFNTLMQVVQFTVMAGICIVLMIIAIDRKRPIPYLLTGFAWIIVAIINFILTPTGWQPMLSWFLGLLGVVFLFAAFTEYARGLGDDKYAKRYGTEPV